MFKVNNRCPEGEKLMYNHKKAQIKTRETALREHKPDPSADDNQAIWEKELPHREGDK